MWGKSGGIAARVVSVTANGRTIRCTGQMNDKGTTGSAGVVGAALLLPVAGFFTTGTSAVIHSGSTVRAFTEEDVPVAFAGNAAPAPMIVAPAGVRK